jgi:hypothetical protein
VQLADAVRRRYISLKYLGKKQRRRFNDKKKKKKNDQSGLPIDG